MRKLFLETRDCLPPLKTEHEGLVSVLVALWQMENGGLPIIVGVIALACGFVGTFTNRRFGHPTFFAPHQKGKNFFVKEAPPRQPQHQNACSDSSSSSVFADLPGTGVVEHIASFLSPADLVGVAPVCVDLSRVSACGILWKNHCVRIFGGVDSVLGEHWREAQRLPPQRRQQCERSQCSGVGNCDEPVDAAGRDGTQQQYRHHRLRLPNTQSRRNSNRNSNNSSGSSSSASLHPVEPLTESEDAAVKKDQPGSNSSSGSSSSSSPVIIANNIDSTATSTSLPPSPPPPPTHLIPLPPPPPPATAPSPCPSCSCSWKEAFFYAHRERPRLLVELAPPATSCVVLIHGRVHDLTDFLPEHPGGSMILREHASTDATRAFERFFHSREARRIAREFVVWDGVAVMGRKGTLWKVARDL